MGKVTYLVLATSLLVLSCSSSEGDGKTTDMLNSSDIGNDTGGLDVAAPADLSKQEQFGIDDADETDAPDMIVPPDEETVVAPVVVTAELDPVIAGAGDEVTLFVTLNVESPGGPEGISLLVQTMDGSVVEFNGPTQGQDTTYAWTSTIDEEVLSGEILCAFFVTVVDSNGTPGEQQSLQDDDGQPLQLRIDLEAPLLVGPEKIIFNHYAMGIPTGTEPDENLFFFDFMMDEWNPVVAGNECADDCPEVRLGAELKGSVSRRPELDDPSASELGFRFSYDVDMTQWGEVEKELDVLIAWEDIVGNDSETLLPEPMRLDFIRPSAVDCSLTPQIANPTTVLTYSMTVTEPLAAAPEVITEAELQIFINEPEVSGGGLTYTWSQPAAGLPPMEFAVSAVLTDTAGNESDGPVCPASGSIAASGPTVKDVLMTTQPEVVNGAGEVVTAVGDGSKLLVSLVIDSALELLPGSPMVMLSPAGPPLMLMPTGKESLGGISTQYTYELTLDADQHAAAEGTWPIKFMAEDTASNKLQIDALGDALIRVDFTPPVAECALVPPSDNPYTVGDTVTLVVTPLEELATDSLPEVEESFTPSQAAPWLVYEADTHYQFTGEAVQNMAGVSFDLSVRMTDLLGNETSFGSTGCLQGILSGTVAQ
jgi:hypothetical protein